MIGTPSGSQPTGMLLGLKQEGESPMLLEGPEPVGLVDEAVVGVPDGA